MKRSLLFLAFVLLAGCSSRPQVIETAAANVGYQPIRSGAMHGILYQPSGPGPFPALVLVHEDQGLTEWAKQQARRLAEHGQVVLAVDLYRGEVVDNVLDAHIMDRAIPDERVQGDLRTAVDTLSARADVRRDAIGIIGWDSGGGYALDAAIRDPRLRTAIVCYGRVPTEPASLTGLQGSVFGIFAEKDAGISADTLERFRTAMKKTDKRLAGLHVYPDCGHGFMNPSGPAHSGPPRPEAIADAWQKIDAHLAAEWKK